MNRLDEKFKQTTTPKKKAAHVRAKSIGAFAE
jgi:hypothetical protein